MRHSLDVGVHILYEVRPTGEWESEDMNQVLPDRQATNASAEFNGTSRVRLLLSCVVIRHGTR
jgi:hypothetical protein